MIASCLPPDTVYYEPGKKGFLWCILPTALVYSTISLFAHVLILLVSGPWFPAFSFYPMWFRPSFVLPEHTHTLLEGRKVVETTTGYLASTTGVPPYTLCDW